MCEKLELNVKRIEYTIPTGYTSLIIALQNMRRPEPGNQRLFYPQAASTSSTWRALGWFGYTARSAAAAAELINQSIANI